jgi:hypothetical protein
MDKSILRTKDLIILNFDSLGILASASFDEPLPEEGQNISHLRLIPQKEDQYNNDFLRCLFRIETELVQVSFTYKIIYYKLIF